MVIRDLTLRSAASFGSFHLIRLLYDEYMFYLIEHKVASATGDNPVAVMAQSARRRPSANAKTAFTPAPRDIVQVAMDNMGMDLMQTNTSVPADTTTSTLGRGATAATSSSIHHSMIRGEIDGEMDAVRLLEPGPTSITTLKNEPKIIPS